MSYAIEEAEQHLKSRGWSVGDIAFRTDEDKTWLVICWKSETMG
jgi:hypothetical protein